MAAVPAPAEHRSRTDAVDVALLIVAATQLGLGALAFLAPGAFYDAIASYPPENAHFLKDVGSWQVALGAAALYAVRRPAWRAPMLGILAIQYTLHAISHLIDVDVPDPAWQGTFALVTQALGAVVLAALFLKERAR
jgi:predicted anti-sigma-YlaC factor YlaD